MIWDPTLAAEVVVIHYAEPDITGFAICAKALISKVEYAIENVYDFSKDKYELWYGNVYRRAFSLA